MIFGGEAFIGMVNIETNECEVTLSSIKYIEAGLSSLAGLTGLTKEGIKARTAYPPMYMDTVSYFLTRLGLPRHAYKVVAADPWTVPFKANNGEGIIRNIAYLHGVLELIKDWARENPKTSYAVHRLLLNSDYGADEDLAARARHLRPCRLRLAQHRTF